VDKSLNLACIHDEFRENQFFTITLLVMSLGNMAGGRETNCTSHKTA